MFCFVSVRFAHCAIVPRIIKDWKVLLPRFFCIFLYRKFEKFSFFWFSFIFWIFGKTCLYLNETVIGLLNFHWDVFYYQKVYFVENGKIKSITFDTVKGRKKRIIVWIKRNLCMSVKVKKWITRKFYFYFDYLFMKLIIQMDLLCLKDQPMIGTWCVNTCILIYIKWNWG